MILPRFKGLIVALKVRGRLGGHWGLRSSYFHPETARYRHPKGGGKVYWLRNGVQQVRDFFPPQNPRWDNQMRWREIQCDGVIAAKALTDAQRVPYALRAQGTRIGSWFNVFMRDWLNARGPIIFKWRHLKWGDRKWG